VAGGLEGRRLRTFSNTQNSTQTGTMPELPIWAVNTLKYNGNMPKSTDLTMILGGSGIKRFYSLAMTRFFRKINGFLLDYTAISLPQSLIIFLGVIILIVID
jgi:hypothetical protein